MATWNVWWRFGEWAARREAILTALREARPDICGLQEVPADDTGNLAAHLANELGMEWDWVVSPQPERWRSRLSGATAHVGNAVLSRWPIRDRAELRLPDGGSGDHSRTALLCVVESPAGGVPFATTQLTPAPWDSAARRAQVRALVDAIVDRAREAYPVVLTGDLNAEPDSDEVRLLCGHKTAPVRAGFVLVDAWRYASPGAVPWTWDRTNPHVAATHEPSSRIDYVLVGPPHESGRGHVLSIRRFGDRPVYGTWASDHAGLVAELAGASTPVAQP